MPVDRGALDAQLREIGEGERWWEEREFRELPHVLYAGERILAITTGKLLGRAPRLRPAARWLFLATDLRLLCLKRERFARKQVDIVWGQISHVQQSSGIRSYKITIATPERIYRLRIPKADALRFAAALAPRVPAPFKPRLGPELEALSWIPGITTIAALPPFDGIASKVAMLSPPGYALKEDVERLEATIDRLHTDLERLQQQVTFLEDLLKRRSAEALLSRSPVDS
jgi:hypothetical protein